MICGLIDPMLERGYERQFVAWVLNFKCNIEREKVSSQMSAAMNIKDPVAGGNERRGEYGEVMSVQ